MRRTIAFPWLPIELLPGNIFMPSGFAGPKTG
jgi:hypothetical protein